MRTVKGSGVEEGLRQSRACASVDKPAAGCVDGWRDRPGIGEGVSWYPSATNGAWDCGGAPCASGLLQAGTVKRVAARERGVEVGEGLEADGARFCSGPLIPLVGMKWGPDAPQKGVHLDVLMVTEH